VNPLELDERDEAAVIALWAEAGLVRPWNDVPADFRRAILGATSAILGVKDADELIGTVMVGHDGHRGWVYYLAVSSTRQRQGIGSRLMGATEEWLHEKGAVKVQLMVRNQNISVKQFYEEIGYENSDVRFMSKWL
jgi:ribosomal protein S18 acetylase RimI-like enzyme